jgi:hypothetical protein
MKLHHAGRFTEGQEIKGYDFPGTKDSYVQGVIIDADHTHPGIPNEHPPFKCYHVRITRRVLHGHIIHSETGTEGWIPHEVGFFEYNDRIELVK